LGLRPRGHRILHQPHSALNSQPPC
jgi:hypothetical protein